MGGGARVSYGGRGGQAGDGGAADTMQEQEQEQGHEEEQERKRKKIDRCWKSERGRREMHGL